MRQVSRIIRGSLWLWLSSVVNNVSGFVYWLLVSALTNPDTVGIVSAVAGLASLVSGALALGIGSSLLRFYGEVLSRDREELGCFFWSALAYLMSASLLVSTLLIILAVAGARLGPYDPPMLVAIAASILISSVLTVVDPLVLAMLRTSVKLIASLTGNLAKLVVGISLVALGYGWVGAFIGYLMPGIFSALIEGLYIRGAISRPRFSVKILKMLLVAGFVVWLPMMIDSLGRWLGVLVIFGSMGARETGLYYVAFMIASFIAMIPGTLTTLLIPVASGLREGRSELASKVLKLSIVASAPLAAFVFAQPSFTLSLIGKSYREASLQLQVLAVSLLPLAICMGINALAYAERRYRIVLGLGLASNTPRVILYTLLTPALGGLGAAISYLAGSVTGCVAAVSAAWRLGYRLEIGKTVAAFLIPFIAAYLTFSFNPLVTALAVAVSIPVYGLTRVLTRSEARVLATSLLPRETVDRLYARFKPLVDIVLRE